MPGSRLAEEGDPFVVTLLPENPDNTRQQRARAHARHEEQNTIMAAQ